MQKDKKLLDIVRDKIRFKHYSVSTEKTYIVWIKHSIFFHNKRHPVEMKNRVANKSPTGTFFSIFSRYPTTTNPTQNPAIIFPN
jgi:hypothetical protein